MKHAKTLKREISLQFHLIEIFLEDFGYENKGESHIKSDYASNFWRQTPDNVEPDKGSP